MVDQAEALALRLLGALRATSRPGAVTGSPEELDDITLSGDFNLRTVAETLLRPPEMLDQTCSGKRA